MEEIIAGNTPTAGQQTTEVTATKPVERTFTKDEVNSLMQKRIDRSHKAFFSRYGVNDLNELDALFGQASSYGPLKEQFDELTKSNTELTGKYDELTKSHSDLTKKYAYKVGNVNQEKTSDIEAYFKGKNLEIDENTLMEELKTHPEWVTKVSSIQPLGAEAQPTPTVDEKALAEKYFGVKFRR